MHVCIVHAGMVEAAVVQHHVEAPGRPVEERVLRRAAGHDAGPLAVKALQRLPRSGRARLVGLEGGDVQAMRPVLQCQLGERRRGAAPDLEPAEQASRHGSKRSRVGSVTVEVLVHGIEVRLVVGGAEAPHADGFGWLRRRRDGAGKVTELAVVQQLAHERGRRVGVRRLVVVVVCRRRRRLVASAVLALHTALEAEARDQRRQDEQQGRR